MRVAILGDIHGNTHYLDWALENAVAQGAEMMIQLGDFGFDFRDSFMSNLIQVSKKHDIRVMVVRGNHDDPKWFNQHTQMGRVNLIPDGFITTIGKKRVAFLGGAVSIDRADRQENISWWKDERVSPHIINAWSYDDAKADILISHDSPLLPDKLPGLNLPPQIKRDAEEDRNFVRTAAEILEPDVIYHGHYHVRHQKHLYLNAKKTLIEGLNCDGNPINQSMIIRDW